MKIQEKIWVVIDAEGKPLTAKTTREKARSFKKAVDGEMGQLLMPHSVPTSIVQYKRWKKAN